jgi:hypothetical protein
MPFARFGLWLAALEFGMSELTEMELGSAPVSGWLSRGGLLEPLIFSGTVVSVETFLISLVRGAYDPRLSRLSTAPAASAFRPA